MQHALTRTLLSITIAVLVAVGTAVAGPSPSEEHVAKAHSSGDFSPYAKRSFPTRPLFGDQHLHTAVSVDAGTMNRLGQESAYKFARGEEVLSTHGLKARLSRPLDWLVIADHAEMYGLMPALLAGDPGLLATELGQSWYTELSSGDSKRMFDTAMEIVGSLQQEDPPFDSAALVKHAWREYADLADRYNEPGVFSAIIGFEYTTRGGFNLHRNVLFRGDAATAKQIVPFSQFDSQNPEDLWQWMDDFEKRSGAEVLAIPHNGNLSNGLMFSLKTNAGKPYSRKLAKLRARIEPIVEVTQIKGDSESHPFLSPPDEFSDYELWDDANLDGTEVKDKDMLQYEYAREALKNGLKLEKKLGVNPFKFGMAAGTDAHTSLAAVEENNFFGKHSGVEPEPHRYEHVVIQSPVDPELTTYGWQQASAGYTAVWAMENTREAIFDAMMRKEVYATTGPRMTVRFFGGWDFAGKDALSRLPAGVGYSKGVPMGGDLRKAPKGVDAPNFLVAAVKDPYSGNLDRIQIVKGWKDRQDKTHEKVYDVAWSGDRKPGSNGKLPPVGNTVDVKNATWTNTIGDPELIAVWTDPDFNPEESAFYYARVIEIPTPRWTAYEAKRFKVDMPAKVPMVTQERAYTSPIWYNP
jgi:hypothetical protein